MCFQMVMAVFAYIYHQSFVVPQDYTVEMIMDEVITYSHTYMEIYSCVELIPFLLLSSLCCFLALQILSSLTLEEQQNLYKKLGQILQDRVLGLSQS